MGKTYIKKGVLYEENTSPFFFLPDKKLGELHENWDGSLETRNAFSENYELTQERDSWDDLEEVITCVIPGANTHHGYKVETSDGESGTLKWNSRKKRHELEDKLTTHSGHDAERTSESSYSRDNGNCGGQTHSSIQESKKKNLDGMVRESNKNVFYISSYTSPEAIKRAAKDFASFVFIPDSYLLTYRCDRCGHEWHSSTRESYEPPKETVRCLMGCSEEDNGFLLSLYRLISSLISHKKPFGDGRLIKSEKIGPTNPR